MDLHSIIKSQINMKYLWFYLPLLSLFSYTACANDRPVKEQQIEKSLTEKNNMENIESIVLGGGCFWCVEAVYLELKGVISVKSGYAGGTEKNPTYREVASGMTSHAEVIKVEFDPNVVSLEEIFEVFFFTHDPTTLNRQGNDKGPQYRSIILYTNDEQKALAEKYIDDFAPTLWEDPIVTELKKLDVFYEAEDYHQEYFSNNPNQPYCQFVVNPKVQKFRKKFADKLKN